MANKSTNAKIGAIARPKGTTPANSRIKASADRIKANLSTKSKNKKQVGF